jgi:hypothetical protein
MSINFAKTPTAGPVKGTLRYVPSDYAFRFEPDQGVGEYSSIQINSLQLAVDERGVLLYAYGYCPIIRYQETELLPPKPDRAASLVAQTEKEFVPGIAVGLGGPASWPVRVNKRSGWVCLGEPSTDETLTAVEFATGLIAVVRGSQLVCVWLRPVALPSDLADCEGEDERGRRQ